MNKENNIVEFDYKELIDWDKEALVQHLLALDIKRDVKDFNKLMRKTKDYLVNSILEAQDE